MSASKFQRDASQAFEQAMRVPPRIGKMKQSQRRASKVRDLSPEMKEAIRRAEIPAEHRYGIDDID